MKKILVVLFSVICFSIPSFANDWNLSLTIKDNAREFPRRVREFLVGSGIKIDKNTYDQALRQYLKKVLLGDIKLHERNVEAQQEDAADNESEM